MPQLVDSLWGHSKFKTVQTLRPVTPFGGLVSFIGFLKQAGFCEQVGRNMPWQLTSPNAIAPEHTVTAFIIGVVIGARRFAHTELARADRALHTMLGLKRWPGADTVRSFFHRFTQASIQQFWRPLWRWQMELLTIPVTGYSLDLDSTVFQRSGSQQGACKGYNPRRPGRKTHHPLLAVLSEASFVLHGWLRSGNTGSARGVVDFLKEALAVKPEAIRVRCVRADSGFFDEALLGYLESVGLPYLIVVRLTSRLKRMAASVSEWKQIDENYAAGEFTARLCGWSRERRFVVMREKIREGKEAVGRKLIDVPGYTFRMWVTDRDGCPEELWREYNGRATIEQRIEELKNDLGADGFCTQKFWATESAFLAVLFTFNLLTLYQQKLTPQAGYRQPGTLRTAVFLCGAILGRSGRQAVVHLSTAWGGLDKHKPLIDALLHWSKTTSAKLDRAGPSPCGSDGFLQQNPVPT